MAQHPVAQTIAVGAEVGLYWPLVISLMINLLLVLIILRLVLKRENEMNIVYSTAIAPDTEASDEHPPHPFLRVESSRAPVSGSALLSSSSHGFSAEADEVIEPAQVVGTLAEDAAGPEFTIVTSYAQRASATAAMTSDDETEDDAANMHSPEVVRQSVPGYLQSLSLHDTEVLLRRFGYQRHWSVVSRHLAYLQVQNSYQNRELCKSFGAIWHPEGQFWTIPPG